MNEPNDQLETNIEYANLNNLRIIFLIFHL